MKTDLDKLIQDVSCFVNWWADVDTILHSLEEILPQVEADGSNPIRTLTVKARWVNVSAKYTAYQEQVGVFTTCIMTRGITTIGYSI